MAYLQEQISGTILGRIIKGKEQGRCFKSFEEYRAEYGEPGPAFTQGSDGDVSEGMQGRLNGGTEKTEKNARRTPPVQEVVTAHCLRIADQEGIGLEVEYSNAKVTSFCVTKGTLASELATRMRQLGKGMGVLVLFPEPAG